jgi:hypothetical protein
MGFIRFQICHPESTFTSREPSTKPSGPFHVPQK